MIAAFIICFVYILILFTITRFFGVKYTEIIKTNNNIKKGLFLPIGISTVLLTVFAWRFHWLPDVMTFSPRLEVPILWVAPLLFLIGSFARLAHARWQDFDLRGFWYLFFGTLFVGYSEELLVRGIVVSILFENGYSILAAGIISSLLFGIAHGINYFNGQDAKTTLGQMFMTTLLGINFYICFVVSGTLIVPMAIHFLHDITLFLQGGSINAPKSKMNRFDMAIVVGLLISAVVLPFFIV